MLGLDQLDKRNKKPFKTCGKNHSTQLAAL